MVKPEWFQAGNWIVKGLCRKHSDHSPLFFFPVELSREYKPFRIFNCHLTDELFEEIQKWLSCDDNWRCLNIHVALKRVKEIIKERTRGSKDSMEAEIIGLEKFLQEADNNPNKWMDQSVARENLMKLYSKRESMLKKKARLNWLKLGDGNTKFFHKAIQKRRYQKDIVEGCMDNGV